jgi:putative protein-disulfide isomerase
MKLIYIMDPLCGWCYGNAETIQRLHDAYKTEMPIEILPAGMWTGANARMQSKAMAAYIKKHDLHIQQQTGTPFGMEYFKFIEDENIVLDSEIPSRAIVTVQNISPENAIPFALAVQKARYYYGYDLNLTATYERICEALKMNTSLFLTAFYSTEIKEKTQQSFATAQRNASSYPTLLLENNGSTLMLEQGYANYEAIVEKIKSGQ